MLLKNYLQHYFLIPWINGIVLLHPHQIGTLHNILNFIFILLSVELITYNFGIFLYIVVYFAVYKNSLCFLCILFLSCLNVFSALHDEHFEKHKKKFLYKWWNDYFLGPNFLNKVVDCLSICVILFWYICQMLHFGVV